MNMVGLFILAVLFVATNLYFVPYIHIHGTEILEDAINAHIKILSLFLFMWPICIVFQFHHGT